MKRYKAFRNLIVEYDLVPIAYKYDTDLFLLKKLKKIKKILKHKKRKEGGIKFQLALCTVLGKYNLETSEYYEIRPWFKSPMQVSFDSHNIEELIRDSFSVILGFFDSFLHMGSGWFLKKIKVLRLSVFKYNPFGGQQKETSQEIIRKKKSVLDVKGSGNKCFIYSVLAGLHKLTENANLAQSYDIYLDELNLSFLSFPVKLSEIPKFEKKNKVTINVFGMLDSKEKKSEPFPMYISVLSSPLTEGRHIDLLLLNDHFYLIRNLHKFIRPFFWKKTRYFCYKCLISFCSKLRYEKHVSNNCQKNAYTGQGYSTPLKGSTLKFTEHKYQVKSPFVIYADFECYNQTIQKIHKGKSFCSKEHKLNAFGAIMISKYEKYSQDPFIYVGKNVIKKFTSYLYQKRAEISYILDNKRKPLSLSPKDISRIVKQKHCYICGISFTKKGIKKVLDHAHIGQEGKGRDLNYACNRCNLTYTSLRMDKLKIPIVIHNSMNYDTHFLIQKLYKYIGNKTISVIAKSSEKFLTLSFENFKILDSFQFLPTSLSKLAELLHEKGLKDFIQTKKHTSDKNLIPFMIRKGVMCYDYINSWSVLKEKKLPAIDKFYSSLTKKNISKEEYDYAVHMFKALQCKNIEDYLKAYLKIDVLLLCDVFESFREKALNYYSLDPAHFLTAPSLSYQAMLKHTGVELELLSDIEMYNFIESGIRGGITNVSYRHAEVKDSDEVILYIDCNNLYGKCLADFLPLSKFKWLSLKQIKKLKIQDIPDDNETGYILEVDLDYPEEIHDIHNDFPVAPEKIAIKEEELSPYAKIILKETHTSYKKGGKKLICNLKNKINYVVHYRNLKLYLSLGLKISKIHRVLSFHQKDWMKSYILFNNKERTLAASAFMKAFFKLMNNTTFGKTMENVKKRTCMKLTSDAKVTENLIKKPTFKSLHVFQKDFVGIQNSKENLLLDKPMYIGFSVLELSKLWMFNFHYNVMLPKFKETSIQLLYTDTDSLIYHIKDPNYVAKMKSMNNFFDFSNLPESHTLYDISNKAVLGKFKDEVAGKKIKEFIALRPKMYSILFEEGKEEKKVKGVKKCSVEDMRHEDFKMTLYRNKIKQAEFDNIRSINHKVYTMSQRKVSLSPFEDKRYLRRGGIKSLAYGHYKIPSVKRKRTLLSPLNIPCKKIKVSEIKGSKD